MKLTLNIHITNIYFLFIILSFKSLAISDEGRLTLSTYEFSPYVYIQDGQVYGDSIEKIKCTLAQLNKPYKITVRNWFSGYLRLINEKQDGFFIVQESSDLSPYGEISSPMTNQTLTWFYGKDKNYKINHTTKSQLKFAAVYGSQEWFELKRNGYNLIKKPRNIQDLISLLKNKEANVVVADEIAFKSAVKASGEFEDYFNSTLFKKIKLGVYFSNEFLTKEPDFLPDFNIALGACRD